MQTKLKKIKIEKIFLLFSLLFGLMWMMILPPYQAPDEVNHFLRSYMIADGKLMCDNINGRNAGAYFPRSVYELADKVESGKIATHPEVKQDTHLLRDAFNLKVTKEKVYVELPGACVYNPIPYLPQSLGILIGKLMNLPVLTLFYLGRLFNLFVYTLINYFAIKLIPKLKIVTFILALTPMAIHQAASLSADAMTISSAFFIVSYIFYLASLDKVNNKQIIYLAIAGIIVTLAKIVYFPLVWLFCLIPIKNIGNKRKYFIAASAVCGVSLLVFASWMIIVRSVKVIFPVDPKAQLLIILSNPLSFANKLFNTFLTEGDKYYNQFWGAFGWADTTMPTLLGLGFLMALIIAVFTEKNSEWTEENEKNFLFKGVWLLIVFLICAVLIEVTLFLNFSTPNEDIILGVQGRYFIPISMLFFYSLYFLRPTIQKHFYRIIVYGVLLMMLICSYYLFIRYYV